ncbi:hypothetical protein LEP1GSC062_2847 [Leptospira alexanderi serovar Manhao 3 str. L 60]|uniref:Uncharacterized protein n=1 Tax=Leptospira alexanderi serovar Manhao 3 str. L 60 TaxID=1049759 RepID=V6IE95_9LEPT|nr:hypothetical protein LEP1GSC062_2847 [Leptospira alexanderi serovar Manhao 3 str. L 60]
MTSERTIKISPKTETEIFRLNLLYGASKNLYGINVGLLNYIKENLVGFQIGGVNVVDGKAYAAQIGLFNQSEGGFTIQIGAVNKVESTTMEARA